MQRQDDRHARFRHRARPGAQGGRTPAWPAKRSPIPEACVGIVEGPEARQCRHGCLQHLAALALASFLATRQEVAVLASFTRLGPSDSDTSTHVDSTGVEWSGPNYPHCAEWSPAADAFEFSDAFVLKVDLPGISLDDIEIHTGPALLTIKGERTLEAMVPTEERRTIERGFGRFSRAFALPDSVDRRNIVVTLHAGVLVIRLPKRDGESHLDSGEALVTAGDDEPATFCEWCGAEYPLPGERRNG